MNIQKHIRFATLQDINDIIDLCQLHAAYEKSQYLKEGKAEKLSNDLFSDNPNLYCLIVENEKELIAYATYMKQYATWDANYYIYMDCLFVKESFRGMRIGENLVNRIKIEGKKLRCNNMQWQTPDFNTKAIKFYKRIGASSLRKERFFLSIYDI